VSGSLRAFEIVGARAAEALDWLHVHSEALGAIEGDESVTVWLADDLPALPQMGLHVRELPVSDSELHATGLENDAPIRVARDLLVRPPWVDRPADFAGVELVVPRGSAFGSGEHGSTQAALRCLHRVWDAPASFGDVGTGSGILALYATTRGCPRVEACDVDERAVAAARELLPAATVHVGGAAALRPADCVIANMTGSELAGEMPAMLVRWSRRSAFVLSGMRAEEVSRIRGLVALEPCAEETEQGFTALAFRGSA
jgi:ribosomal protein L11 methylase PrmA